MENEPRLTRSELYELVWSAPMSPLAPKYGLGHHMTEVKVLRALDPC